MSAGERLVQRIALIAALVGKAPSGFGRTALMKCLYFLQTVRRVPLGYTFRLYTYGPFDADVLSDLGLAENLEAVKSDLSQFPGGYRYELRAGGLAAQRIIEKGRNFIDHYEQDIDWVVRSFGGRSAIDLESASTLVFIDRSVAQKGNKLNIRELARKVHEVKPHLDMRLIEKEASHLKENNLLQATL
jgi:uncharacterized protein